jgi:hypothetical protein
VDKAVERRRTEVIKSRATLSEVVVVFFMVNVRLRMEPKGATTKDGIAE